MNTQSTWNPGAKFLHWLLALCIAVAATLGWLAESAEISPAKVQLFVWHKSTGLTVLALMILRLLWRQLQAPPAELLELTVGTRRLARLGHWAMYAVALLLPLSGWILNSAANFPFRWFGWFTVPMLTGPDEALQNAASLAHVSLFVVLLALVVGHIGMACKHHRDGVPLMRRILPANLSATATIGAVLVAAAAWVYLAWSSSYAGQAAPGQAEFAPAEAASASSIVSLSAAPDPVADSTILDPPAAETESAGGHSWTVLAEQSRLDFVGSYTGVEFDGRFEQFVPRIEFDPQALAASRFDVLIETASVTTDSVDRDEVLPEEDWFHVARFPQAHYLANRFEWVRENQYRAFGELSLKGFSKPVTLDFEWLEADGEATLTGGAVLNRQDFDIGVGYWRNNPSVGYEVKLKTQLSLHKSAR
ncbi:MAG: cytochrome b/b6 domain-containing protein [Halieaceae bacterium]|nr:cytochrome b/b6 domain-containing protein [Halieaceae bacterium]